MSESKTVGAKNGRHTACRGLKGGKLSVRMNVKTQEQRRVEDKEREIHCDPVEFPRLKPGFPWLTRYADNLVPKPLIPYDQCD